MSENIVLTTGIYDLIKEHLRRRKTKREARKAAKQHIKKGKYSILSPIGLAMVGNKIGDVIEWPFEEGAKKLEILSVVHQN